MSSALRRATSSVLVGWLGFFQTGMPQSLAADDARNAFARIPDVRNMKLAEAADAQRWAGFQPIPHRGDSPASPDEATRVYKLEPPQGAQRPKGTRVDVTCYGEASEAIEFSSELTYPVGRSQKRPLTIVNGGSTNDSN